MFSQAFVILLAFFSLTFAYNSPLRSPFISTSPFKSESNIKTVVDEAIICSRAATTTLLPLNRNRGLVIALFMGRAAAVRAATKAKTDGAKAKNNNRFAKKIIMVVKAGGADPEQNRALASVIADAKTANVPNDVIKRNIEKAGAATTADFKESLFEFVGPGGVGLLVNVLTDNDNRAASEVNLIGKKNKLKSGSKGSVSISKENHVSIFQQL